MSKGILWLVLGVVVVGGGVAYFATANKDDAKSSAAVEEESESNGAAAREASTGRATGKRSLSAIMAEGGSHKCTFASEDPNAKNSGTVYISGKEIRGDFTSVVTAVGMTVQSHMIQTGDYVYTWSDMTPQGVKTARESASGQASGKRDAASGQVSGQASFDAGVELAYDCNTWTPDASTFALPKGVTFSTF